MESDTWPAHAARAVATITNAIRRAITALETELTPQSSVGLPLPTGIETDVQSLQALWKETLKVKCPHCSEMHEISVRETYINGALSDAADRLTA